MSSETRVEKFLGLHQIRSIQLPMDQSCYLISKRYAPMFSHCLSVVREDVPSAPA